MEQKSQENSKIKNYNSNSNNKVSNIYNNNILMEKSKERPVPN